MPIAAVPAYLGRDFKDASPGMRFGMYLPIWTERADQEEDVRKRAEAKSREGGEVAEMLQRQGMDATVLALQRRAQKPLAALWDKNDFAAKQAWKKVTALSPRDRSLAASLLARQQQSASLAGSASMMVLEALAIAPFTTGLGNEHPLENGFAFLNPYGLPYLPGSGVKGVLRQAARELASGDWGDSMGWSTERAFVLTSGRESIPLSMIDALFGLESGNGGTHHVRGALSFWDVIPQIKGDSLMVDVMTPHQSHYYQQKRDGKAGDSDTPHDSGQPNPISFLTVPPESGFAFHVCCDLAHLKQLTPELAVSGRWKTLLATAFEHAFAWLGFGAKTAVGYGAMQEDPKAKKRAIARRQAEAEAARRVEAEQARQAELAQMSPIEREMREFLDARPDKNQTELSALLGALKKGQWTGDSKIAVAERVRTMMQAVKKWKEKSEKKNPDKDNDYQDTLRVMAWIRGE
jgi:CRISPR-associated protein Cmr6